VVIFRLSLLSLKSNAVSHGLAVPCRRDYTTAIVGGQPRGGGFGRHRSYRGGDYGGCNRGGRTNS